MVSQFSQGPREPLAIAGMACRFPGGVTGPESYWELLCAGRSAVTEVPGNRWNWKRYYSPDNAAQGKLVTRWGGFVEQLEEFDADFFVITPREASRMDPQQRWLLETAWEALEDALCPPRSLRGGSTGVFIGLSNSDYGQIQQNFVERIDGYTNSGNALSIASNRISYQFDLKGPSITVDTACSSGLVAVNLACQHIWSGQCSSALAGAASAMILPDGSLGFTKASMLSPNGKCHAFDARADGYVRSEGAGMLFLKPLKDALKDGNRIYAVIRSCVVNQDGKTSSMSVPGLESQSSMLEAALAAAGISPDKISYVEAHGTGTPVGDPIEAIALGRVLSRGRPEDGECLLGSVKSNMGHLETAAGLAGIIKAALVLKHGKIPPSLNFSIPNPNIPFKELKLRVVTELTDLPVSEEGPAFVAVNSFGFGGTNAHALLESPPHIPASAVPEPATARPLIVPVSARCQAAVSEYAQQYQTLFESGSHEPSQICATAALRKEHHEHRIAVLGTDGPELAKNLALWREDPASAGKMIAGVPAISVEAKPVFVFTGQGAQWWAMGRQLLDREPVFRETVGKIDFILQPLASWSLIEELGKPEASSRIHQTEIAQPALFALQAGLVALWKSWGVTPSAVVGHSVGEAAAAFAAGILTLPEAGELVFHRSRLQGTTGGSGRMVVVGISPEQARDHVKGLRGLVEIAGFNSPSLVTLAGDTGPLEKLTETFAAEGKFVRWLPIDYAFHTHQMDPIEAKLRVSLQGLRPRDSTVPFFSTVEGGPLDGEKLDVDYWWRNVRDPVRFAPAIDALITSGKRLFLEIGPHPALESSLRDCLAERQTAGRVFHSLKRESDDSLELAKNFAALHIAGVSVNWQAFLQAAPQTDLPLPSYPWQRKRHWMESPAANRDRTGMPAHPLLGMPVEGPQPRWEVLLDPRSFPWLDDHKFWNRIVFPAAGYVEIGLAVGHSRHFAESFSVEDFEMERVLFLSTSDVSTLRVEFDEEDSRFRVFSKQVESETWNLHATARLVARPEDARQSVELKQIRSRLPNHSAHWDFYESYRESGYAWGPCFRQIEQVWYDDTEALSEVVVRHDLEEYAGDYHFHPALIDACFQTVGAALKGQFARVDENALFLPAGLKSFQINPGSHLLRFWVHIRITQKSEELILCDVDLLDAKGVPFGSIRGLAQSLVRNKSDRPAVEDCFYDFHWEECPLHEPEPATPLRIVLFADHGGTAAALSEELVARGHSIIRIEAGAAFEKIGNAHFVINPASQEDLQRALTAFVDGGTDSLCFVHLWCLDHPEEFLLDSAALVLAQETGVFSLLSLAQFLQKRKIKARVLCGARCFSGGEETGISRIASAPLLGFLRVASNELSEIQWSSLLLDSTVQPTAIQNLAEELTSGDRETEVAYFEGIRHARRLRRTRMNEFPRTTKSIVGPDGSVLPYRIESERPGTLDSLVVNETFHRDLLPDEVEVRVAAAGINFRDLMKALAVYPGEPEELVRFGDDYAGTVTRVGSDVTGLSPGDEVAGLTHYAFQSFVVANRHLLFRKPAQFTFAESATLPTVFFTAHYAIQHLARLQPGESILIHAGTGGVGLAAIQVAQSLGLKIFATAGSESKRQLLRDMGIEHVMDSRTLQFAEDILQATGGRGVDAVLNSLSGEFLPKSLSVLAPFGRFLEIGKVDVYANRKLGMHALRNNISIFIIDMAQVMQTRFRSAAALMEELERAFENGTYRPLPCQVFPADRVQDAFREMAQGKHVGKLVLDFTRKEIVAGRITQTGRLFAGDVTHMISGGNNGFGFEVAKWLARNGARHLALLSRSGPGHEEIAAEIEALRAEGVTVKDVRVDITDASAVQEAVHAVEREMPQVAGIFHAAMVLRDEFISDYDKTSFDAALAPKMAGAWNLHMATVHRDLEFFVCFSSFSGVIGTFKQANYCAGNTFLDELARCRRAIGLQALSINWGALAGAGFVERNAKTRTYLETIGLEPFTIGETLHILEQLLPRNIPQITAARVQWESLLHLFPAIAKLNIYKSVVATISTGGMTGSTRPQILAAPSNQQRQMIEDFIAAQVAAVFGADANTLDRTLPVTRLGLDSIMSIELLNRIERELGIHFPMGSILNGPSIQDLSVPVLDAFLQSDDREKESLDDSEVVEQNIGGVPSTSTADNPSRTTLAE